MMKLNEGFLNSMHEAMTLLRTRGAAEATEVIQRALRGEASGAPSETVPQDETARPVVSPFAEARKTAPVARATRQADVDVEERGHFSTLTYSNAAGSRQYRLYVPAGATGEPLPLVVMLHGCTQDANDFARGTQMNALAERHRCLVAYPVQPREANPSKCWNWFKPNDQHRERGEPSLIAGITREIIAAHNVDPSRVYIAGMSAGGAMAAIMIEAYPELYAAAGVHSGLPAGCAHDLPSALAAMKGGRRGGAAGRAIRDARAPRRPMIVFHGDADATVHITNATRIVQGSMRASGPAAFRDWSPAMVSRRKCGPFTAHRTRGRVGMPRAATRTRAVQTRVPKCCASFLIIPVANDDLLSEGSRDGGFIDHGGPGTLISQARTCRLPPIPSPP
jgi:poly(hydroxyalkanoate) depolymerase family esterase